MFARIGNGVFHYKQSFINTHNKNSSVFQQMEEFFIAYTQTISPFGYGRTFLIAIPNPFSPFGYGRAFLIAYTQSIPKKCPVKVFHRALKHFLLFSYRNFLPDIRQSV